MGDDESRRLRKEVQRLQDYIEDQRKRHAADIKALRDDLHDETKYSKKLRAELEEEYKHCERLRKQLSDKTRLAQDLREDLDDERAYSEKLERKLDKRAKVIKELEADLLDLEDDYAEARTALKRTDELRRELENAKIHRLYSKQRVAQLQNEVHSLRSDSRSSSPSQAPAYTTASLRYRPSSSSPPSQVHVVTSTSHRHVPNSPSQNPAPFRRVATPPSATPELESDYSEDEIEYQDGRLTEEEEGEEETAEAEADAVEYSDAGDGEEPVTPETRGADDVDDAPGQKLRGIAVREGRLTDREYERAREAYASGDKTFAKKLEDAGAEHRNNMRNYNRMAAAEIFNHHNPDYHSKPSSRVKMDLHHLHVREATEFVEKHMELCRAAGIHSTEIISGRGNHSAGGVARLRPAILELLESQRDIEVDQHETNPGRIVVRFTDTWKPEDDATRPKGRIQGSPEHAGVEDEFEQGRIRLRAATRAAADVRQGLDEIEQGMSTMQIKPETRRGLRDITNNS